MQYGHHSPTTTIIKTKLFSIDTGCCNQLSYITPVLLAAKCGLTEHTQHAELSGAVGELGKMSENTYSGALASATTEPMTALKLQHPFQTRFDDSRLSKW